MAKYYYVDDNKQKSGPVNPEEFLSLGITEETLVWTKGLTQWTKAGQIPELADIFAAPEEQAEAEPEEEPMPEEEAEPEEEQKPVEEPKTEEEPKPEPEAKPEEEPMPEEESKPVSPTKTSPSSSQQKGKIIVGVAIFAIVIGVLMYIFRNTNESAIVNAETTPDLAMLYLQGPVKSVIVLRKNTKEKFWEETATYEFDEQGRLTSYPGWPEPYIISYENSENGMVITEGGYPVERDEQGRIISLSVHCPDFDNTFGLEWKYDADEVSEYVDHYDKITHVVSKTKEGLPLIVEKEQAGKGMTEYWTWNFTYTQYDDYGNYVEATYTEENRTYFGEFDTEDTSTSEGTEKRVITYYK